MSRNQVIFSDKIAFDMADLKKSSILTREAMLSEIHKCWTSLQIREACISLIKSMPRKIAAVIQAKGGLTKY